MVVSLYFHIPFCTKKCPYCHFFVVKDNETLKRRYLAALKKEWELKKPLLEGKEIASIYFGGGTPSLLSIADYEEIFSWFEFSAPEITLEANPESVSYSYFQEIGALGVNRVSLGVQTLDDKLLKKLGRGHNAAQAESAVWTVHEAGIDNISIDLMYDIPNQSLASFAHTLEAATQLPITHLSLYNLTLEPHTPFYQKKAQLQKHLPTPEESLAMLELALTHLANAHFTRYEISAFAKNNLASRHNTGYWEGRPFLGFGPSAFSYWDHSRSSNVSNLLTYERLLCQNQSPATFSETLSPSDRYKELIAIRLRLLSGFSLSEYQDLPPDLLSSLTSLQTQGLLELTPHLRLTPRGTLFYDTVATQII